MVRRQQCTAHRDSSGEAWEVYECGDDAKRRPHLRVPGGKFFRIKVSTWHCIYINNIQPIPTTLLLKFIINLGFWHVEMYSWDLIAEGLKLSAWNDSLRGYGRIHFFHWHSYTWTSQQEQSETHPIHLMYVLKTQTIRHALWVWPTSRSNWSLWSFSVWTTGDVQ